ncbi:MAG: HAMP domain-containing histidine kinase [Ruminococcaceae bacterium]|nr:HAMP domain-containing histidine kinase [Oscillospiraceae bacterium]
MKIKPMKIKPKFGSFSSITTRLVFTYFLIMLITLFLFSYYILTTIRVYLYDDEKLNVATMSNVVASFAVDYMDPETGLLDEDGFERFVNEVGVDSQMRVMVLGLDATVMYDSQNNRNLIGTAQVRPSVLTAINGTDGYMQYTNDDGMITLDASAPIKNSDGNIVGVVNVVYVPETTGRFVNTIFTETIFLIVVICVFVGIIIFVIANLVSKRIVDFTSKITSMSDDGILDEKLDISGNDEISRLGEAFNIMSEKVVTLEQHRVQFVSDASHELKTPLSSIKLMADSILQNPDIGMDYVREFLEDMNTEVDRLNRIVNKLLYITRMDAHANDDDKRMELLCLNDVMAGIERNLKPIADKKDISLIFSTPGTIFLTANKDVLWQGIYNIVDNAIKYSDPEGYVLVAMDKVDGEVVIEVRDSGVGIASEDISKIFDRFYRVDKARSRETGGTGLGLSIAIAAIQFHGGRIDVTSELGQGSNFKIIIPDTTLAPNEEVEQ